VTLRVLIVDDEAPARERLRQLLGDEPNAVIAGEAADGIAALDLAQQTRPDVVLLDIRMPGMDGIETAQHLATLAEPPAVVFVTAYDEYALAAFDAQAAGYLLKPARREKLQAALASARRVTRAQLAAISRQGAEPRRRTQIAARLREQIRLIPVDEVLYFLADQKYVTVRHRHGQELIEESLKALEEEFAPDFVRIHRNALVAVAAIEALHRPEDGQLEVQIKGSAERLQVSRRLAADLMRRIRP
jgi:two-component system, LytTR family, response regulator AlgR